MRREAREGKAGRRRGAEKAKNDKGRRGKEEGMREGLNKILGTALLTERTPTRKPPRVVTVVLAALMTTAVGPE